VGNNTKLAAADSDHSNSNSNNSGYTSVAAKINAVNSHTAAARLAISTGSQPGSAGPSTGAGMASSAKRGVHISNNGNMLLQQLSQLMDLVSHSVPHFVRCIKVGQRNFVFCFYGIIFTKK
jgi:hypothetical protein